MEKKGLKKYKQILKEEGFKGLLKHGGWKLVLGVIIYYLIRDTFLYILLPIYIAKNVSNESSIVMTTTLVLHSLLRYVLLGVILISIYLAFSQRKGDYTEVKGLKLFTNLSFIFINVMMVLGIVLYFGNNWHKLWNNMSDAMGSAASRFFMLEHMLGMILAIALISIGRAKYKKAEDAYKKAKAIKWFFGIALIIIFLSIPWPFRDLGRGWLPM